MAIRRKKRSRKQLEKMQDEWDRSRFKMFHDQGPRGHFARTFAKHGGFDMAAVKRWAKKLKSRFAKHRSTR